MLEWAYPPLTANIIMLLCIGLPYIAKVVYNNATIIMITQVPIIIIKILLFQSVNLKCFC